MPDAPAIPLYAMRFGGFVPGAKLEVTKGSFRGIGFGGQATVAKFDASTFELDVRVTKLLFHIDVKLRFYLDAQGNIQFFGGRPDGKRTGREPAHVKHTMTVKSQTPERTVFEFQMEDGKPGVVATKQVAVEKTRAKGTDAMRLQYERIEMTLVPKGR
jgi:hypothetical protein